VIAVIWDLISSHHFSDEMKKFVVVFILLVNILFAFGQEKPTPYREQIAIHLNATEFLVGEHVLMTVYCMDASSKQPSSLSSIVYVELIGEDMKPILQSKVRLQNSIGGGHFLLPNHINSGNYTLIAYTRWMRNFSEKNFFRKELTIISPLRLDPNLLTTEIQPIQKSISSKPESSSLSLVRPDKEQYGLRELVTLSLTNRDSLTTRFSISVRAIEDDNFFNGVSESEITINQGEPLNDITRFQFLPDLRGELITGIVLEKSIRLPLKGSLVSLSVPAKNFQFLISHTDSTGRFYFHVPAIESSQLFFGLPGKDGNDFIFEVDNPFLETYDSFIPSKFSLGTKHLGVIEKRFMYQQIDDTFSSVWKDSIKGETEHEHFYGIPEKRYVLDRFTRFPTMEDVFREIIPEVIVKKRGDSFFLELYNFKYGYRFDGPPLILIDGILVDAALVMAYDPMNIKQISVRNIRYFYGAMACNGILSIETFTGEAKGLKLEGIKVLDYISPMQQKLFFIPKYDQKIDLSRVPDYRIQLFWNADVIMKGGNTKTLSFFTSDIPGKYSIDIRGVKSNGEWINQSHTFQVLDNKKN